MTSYTVEVDSEENPDVKEKVTYNERDALFDGKNFNNIIIKLLSN